MIVNNRIKVMLTYRNVRHYKDLGVELPTNFKNGKCCIEYGKYIEIDISMLKKGSDQIVEVYCDNCLEKGIEKLIYKKYNNLLRDRYKNDGKDGCVNCARSKSGSKQRLGSKIISELFKKKNLTILFEDNECTSVSIKLKFKCKVHYDLEQSISYNNLLKSEYPCKICRHKIISNKNRICYKEAIEYFIKRKLNPMFFEHEFDGCDRKLKFTCDIHINNIQEISYNSLKVTKNGCKLCFNKAGSQSHAWKGGITTLTRNMRLKIKYWSLNKIIDSHYKCQLSGKIGGKLIVHHIKNFHLILEEVLFSLNLQVYSDISKYSNNELISIKNRLIELHDNCESAVICDELHKLFHKLYGKKNNNKEQYNIFKNRYRNFEFDNLLSSKYKFINH